MVSAMRKSLQELCDALCVYVYVIYVAHWPQNPCNPGGCFAQLVNLVKIVVPWDDI